MLGLHHELLLLDLLDDHGTYQSGGNLHSYGLSAAAVAELEQRGRLKVAGADLFGIASGEPSGGALGIAEGRLRDQPRSMKASISRVNSAFWSSPIAQIRRAALDELVRAGILAPRTDTFIFVPWRTRYVTVDSTTEHAIVARLRTHLARVDGSDPPRRDDLLISLLRAMELLTAVWSEAELQRLRPAIEERTRRAPIGKLAWELAREADAAAAAAALAATVN